MLAQGMNIMELKGLLGHSDYDEVSAS